MTITQTVYIFIFDDVFTGELWKTKPLQNQKNKNKVFIIHSTLRTVRVYLKKIYINIFLQIHIKFNYIKFNRVYCRQNYTPIVKYKGILKAEFLIFK